jgi:predicted CXXCH cytochrome family protein
MILSTPLLGQAAPHPKLTDVATVRCTVCHQDLWQSGDVVHAPAEDDCTTCHEFETTGRSMEVRLIDADPELCLLCHDDQGPGVDETAHPAIEVVGCRACHDPHGSPGDKLLRREGPRLCLSCHDRGSFADESGQDAGAKVRVLGRFEVPALRVPLMATLRLSADGQHGHPLRSHRVQGTVSEEGGARTSFRGELECLSCHNPHKGRSKLLNWDARSSLEACAECHLLSD